MCLYCIRNTLHQQHKALLFLVKLSTVQQDHMICTNFSLCQKQHVCLVLDHQGCPDKLLLCRVTSHLVEVKAGVHALQCNLLLLKEICKVHFEEENPLDNKKIFKKIQPICRSRNNNAQLALKNILKSVQSLLLGAKLRSKQMCLDCFQFCASHAAELVGKRGQGNTNVAHPPCKCNAHRS